MMNFKSLTTSNVQLNMVVRDYLSDHLVSILDPELHIEVISLGYCREHTRVLIRTGR